MVTINTMPKRKSKSLLPRLRLENKPLFALGLLLLTSFLVYRIHLLLRLSFAANPTSIDFHTSSNASLPTRIRVPRADIDLDVFPTLINEGIWQINPRGASYLFTSARPDQSGPIIIYAHNTRDRFGPLKRLNRGDVLLLSDELGKTHQYQVEQILTVSPDHIEALQANEETLVIYTCTGWLDSQRLVIRGLPIEES